MLLLLFAGTVLTSRALYLRGKATLAAILIRKAWDETLKTDRPTPPWSWADTFPVARLEIPAIGYDEVVLEGASPRNLAFGPARLMNTAAPGAPGNVVLAGHRTSWFRPLERVRDGDTLVLAVRDPATGGERRRVYRVATRRVIDPRDTSYLQPTGDDRLTLITCWPFGRGATSPQRFVVQALARPCRRANAPTGILPPDATPFDNVPSHDASGRDGRGRRMMHVRSAGRSGLFGLALALSSGAAWAHDYNVVANAEQTVGPLVRTSLTVQDGADPLDRFEVTRLRLAGPQPPRGVLLLLPPAGNRFGFYEWDESGDPLRSFAAFFAQRRIEVWGYSPRESGLVAGTCGVTLDCSAAAHWGLDTQLDDVAFVRTLIRGARPHARVAVSGFSLGAINSVATIDAHPDDYAGAAAVEGSPWAGDAAIQAYNQPFCAQLTGAVAAGVLLDEQSGTGLKLLSVLAQTDPSGPTPVPGFPPGTTNAQALVLALVVHQDVPVQPTPTYVLAAGDPATATLSYASLLRLTTSIPAGFNDAVALASLRDVSCGLAGDARFVSNLGAYRGALLTIESGRAFGPITDTLIARLPNADVRRLRYAPFGHLDAVMNAHHLVTYEGPIYLWLLAEVF